MFVIESSRMNPSSLTERRTSYDVWPPTKHWSTNSNTAIRTVLRVRRHPLFFFIFRLFTLSRHHQQRTAAQKKIQLCRHCVVTNGPTLYQPTRSCSFQESIHTFI